MPYQTILYETGDDHVATITLNRPEVLNSFNQTMLDEFSDAWRRIRLDDNVHVVVLRAAGERAFSTGADRKDGIDFPENPWSQEDPGIHLGPKQNRVWKPVVCAVNGMAAGGAFYWINESDILICSEDATFFDPHVTYGLTAALEPIGLSHRIPLGDALRIALLGLDERMSAQRALAVGLVTEVVPQAKLWERSHTLAAKIAAKPAAAVQGTVKAIWDSRDMARNTALGIGMAYTQIGNPLGLAQVDPAMFSSGQRPEWELR